MKRTLQVVSAALLLAVASVTAQAQGGGGGGGGGGRGLAGQREALFKDITLTAAQTTTVDSLYKAATDKQAELRKDMQPGTPMTDEMRAKQTAIRTDLMAAIKKALTPEQVTTFDKNVAAMPQGRGRGGL